MDFDYPVITIFYQCTDGRADELIAFLLKKGFCPMVDGIKKSMQVSYIQSFKGFYLPANETCLRQTSEYNGEELLLWMHYNDLEQDYIPEIKKYFEQLFIKKDDDRRDLSKPVLTKRYCHPVPPQTQKGVLKRKNSINPLPPL